MKRLLKESIIKPSLSPWRAQVVVIKDEYHRKRLAIDYSQTLNRFTLLNAFTLPRIRDMVNKIPSTESTALLIFEVHIIRCHSRIETRLTQRLKLEAVHLPAFRGHQGHVCFQREMMKFVDEKDLEASFKTILIYKLHHLSENRHALGDREGQAGELIGELILQ